MHHRFKPMDLALAAMLTGMLIAAPALAKNFMASEKHHGGGGNEEMDQGKHGRGHQGYGGDEEMDQGGHGHGHQGYRGDEEDDQEEGHGGGGGSRYFTDQERAVIHGYFAQEYARGNCPPGLAKKHNGCMPPGQAKKWAIGRRLPRDVVYYELPPRVVAALPPCPPHHKYVRVAQDILLLATGTGMVEDAIDNLSWEFRH
ncbi:MAG: hypothetical protein M0017_00775 [Desulfobacteraceae bacterium]|nr:hypothetical protein [Desulfobacteraceae bacterium]